MSCQRVTKLKAFAVTQGISSAITFTNANLQLLGAMSFNNIFQSTFVYVIAGGGRNIDLFQQA